MSLSPGLETLNPGCGEGAGRAVCYLSPVHMMDLGDYAREHPPLGTWWADLQVPGLGR